MQTEQVNVERVYRWQIFKITSFIALVTFLVASGSTGWFMFKHYHAQLVQKKERIQQLLADVTAQQLKIDKLIDNNTELSHQYEQMQWSASLWDKEMMARYLTRKKFIYLSQAREIVDHVFAYSETYMLDPLYMFIFWYSESGGDHRAVSSLQAWGYTQVLLSHNGRDVWRKYLTEREIIKSDTDLFDPQISINAGGHIFRHYLNEALKAKPDADYATILEMTVQRYKGGKDPKYLDRIRDIFGHYSMWVMTEYANSETSRLSMRKLYEDGESLDLKNTALDEQSVTASHSVSERLEGSAE